MALNGLAPEYIADLLQAYVPTRSLRSAGAHLLLEPKSTTRWGGLKTYLFKAAFL